MAQRRFHYESAFAHFLRCKRVPYVAVDEARKALVSDDAAGPLKTITPGQATLKSFDFLVYGRNLNFLIDVKGRRAAGGRAVAGGGNQHMHPALAARPISDSARRTSRRAGRLESWVTREDVRDLTSWQKIFGSGFRAAFVFVYWLPQQPPDGWLDEVFCYRKRWYGLRKVDVDVYRKEMVSRSQSWRTVEVPGPVFSRISGPMQPPVQ